MKLPVNEMLYTGFEFFGQRIYLVSTGDKEVDIALLSVFHDSYSKTRPLRMAREDVKIMLAWSRKEKLPANERRKGQAGLFE